MSSVWRRLLIGEFTVRRMGYDAGNIMIWGRSVGSGPAVELATRRKARAVVPVSPFASAFRVASRIRILPFDKFNNLGKMKDMHTPLFIIHGDHDTIVRSWHSKRLFDRHSGPKERLVVDGAGHNDLWTFPLASELAKLADFLGPLPRSNTQ